MHAHFGIALSLLRAYGCELSGDHRVLPMFRKQRQANAKFERNHVGEVGPTLRVRDLGAPIGPLLRTGELHVSLRGIQLRDAAVKRWGERPDVLRALLADRKLTLVALSSGTMPLDPAKARDAIGNHVRNATFLQRVGGHYLQIIDERPQSRAAESGDYRRMGELLTELGRRTADLGIPVALHNHMGGLSEKPDELDRVLAAADPRYVKLELDIAHYHQAGGVPADAIKRHADRLLFLHIKDVQSPAPGKAPTSYRFVELGRGTVDIAGAFKALDAVGFDGWAIVELDDVPDKATTPKQAAEVSTRYLRQLGLEPTAP